MLMIKHVVNDVPAITNIITRGIMLVT